MRDSGVHALYPRGKGLGQVVKRLRAELSRRLGAVSEDADFEAEVLLETVLGRDLRLREILGTADVTSDDVEKLNRLADRRISGEPLQYIVGEWEFCGLGFSVGEGVLIPRQDTETLVEVSLGLIRDIEKPRVADLCAGSGCVAAAIKTARPDAEVTAVELSPEAFVYLEKNSAKYGVAPILGDVLSPKTAGRFSSLDLITANPPYLSSRDMTEISREVAHEPRTALVGGDDGLDFYRIIPALWRDSLSDGGYIAFEVGLGQAEDAAGLILSAGYKDVGIRPDLTGRDRVVFGRK